MSLSGSLSVNLLAALWYVLYSGWDALITERRILLLSLRDLFTKRAFNALYPTCSQKTSSPTPSRRWHRLWPIPCNKYCNEAHFFLFSNAELRHTYFLLPSFMKSSFAASFLEKG